MGTTLKVGDRFILVRPPNAQLLPLRSEENVVVSHILTFDENVLTFKIQTTLENERTYLEWATTAYANENVAVIRHPTRSVVNQSTQTDPEIKLEPPDETEDETEDEIPDDIPDGTPDETADEMPEETPTETPLETPNIQLAYCTPLKMPITFVDTASQTDPPETQFQTPSQTDLEWETQSESDTPMDES